jgi:hypothetical protein
MKIVLYILIIAAAGCAGWIAQPSIYQGLKERLETRKAAKAKEHDAIAQKAKNEAAGPSGANYNAAVLEAIMNKSGSPANPASSEPGSPTASNPGNSTAGTAPGVSRPPTPAVDEIDARYPMPTFRTIEEITKEWSAIPSRAFPRKVKTKVDLSFDTPTGKVEMPSGSEAKAAGMVAGMLIVMREGDDSSRIQVPLANTDLKDTMTSLYEKYKEYRRNIVLKQRAHAKALKARSNGASEQQMALAGPKPEVRAGGVIPIMLDDILTGKHVELKANTITAWGKLDFEEIKGIVYWTGTVQCTVENPLFGPTPTEVMALMKDNKVVRWIYTGSLEEVQ